MDSLVELSVMISLPGARAQEPHTDIPPFACGTLCTTWVALQDVTPAMGPTVIYPYSHIYCNTKELQRAASQQRQYDSLGRSQQDRAALTINKRCVSAGDVELVDTDTESTLSRGLEEKNPLEDSETTANPRPSPDHMLLRVGEMVSMNAKVLHYGAANHSQRPRALLNVTFQEPEQDGSFGEIDGFTYHINPLLHGRYRVADFLVV